MIFNLKKHNSELYNTLLSLSRNIFFYKKIKLSDNFESRIYLMFLHFSIMMIISKKKGVKFNQDNYDSLFYNIEYNLREMGFGDVSVNKKMKDLNKVLYDILLKIEKKENQEFQIDDKLLIKYFPKFTVEKGAVYEDFKSYFLKFYNFCFELPLNNMVRDAIKFNN
tara:strand:+ start:242 stop:739 length:498 start_codon:yes stop_codon:yes gene_type:complete